MKSSKGSAGVSIGSVAFGIIALLIVFIVLAGAWKDASEFRAKIKSPPPTEVYTPRSLPARASSIQRTALLELRGIWYSKGYHDNKMDGDAVQEIAFSGDGKLALVSGHDTLRLWNVETQKLIDTLSVHFESWHYRFFVQNTTGGVSSPVVSPDGILAATDFNRTEFKVWNLKTGRERLHVKGHKSNVSDLLFSADGKRLYSASYDRSVKVWDVETGRLLKTFDGYKDWVDKISISPKEDLLLAVMRKGSEMRNVKTGARVDQLGGIRDLSKAMDMSRDWNKVLMDEEAPKIWEVGSGRMLYPCPQRAALNPDWTIAAVGRLGAEKTKDRVTLIDLGAQKQIDELDLRSFLKGSFRGVSALSFAPDGNGLFLGTLEGEVLHFGFAAQGG